MFNKLTDAQLERLYVLSEELGEVQQVIGKVLRHGYESTYPGETETNLQSLQRELGDVFCALKLMDDASDIDTDRMIEHAVAKEARVQKYLHHQNDKEV